MKSRILLMLVGALTMGSLAFGDIQSPPAGRWTWSRKLSRALANICYGTTEYPYVWGRVKHQDGGNAAAASFVVDGTVRSVVRLGYGLYELVTFPCPTYKDGYRPPYKVKDNLDYWHGYSEWPPQVGFIGESNFSRTQHY
jgi:putative exosortase-associated protein (TIGR04073 family)